MKALLAGTILGLLATSAPAQKKEANANVFGFHLGEKLSIPECAWHYAGESYFYAQNDLVSCFERSVKDPKSPMTNERISIRFSVDKQPQIVFGSGILAWIAEGKIESVCFDTRGLSDQNQILSALKEKYGRPSSTSEIKKQNTFGATFDSHFAVWKFANLTVIFQGTTDRVDGGLVNIDTKKGADFRSELLKQSHAGPKL
jgi:hypothetical protein